MTPSVRAEIIEEVITHLGGSLDIADRVDQCLGLFLEICAKLPPSNVAVINRLAKQLAGELALFDDAMPVPLREGDSRLTMPMRELRSALQWLQHISGGPSRKDPAKFLAANMAAGLSKELSQRSRGERYASLEAIAGLFYQAFSGARPRSMKRSVDAAIRWRNPGPGDGSHPPMGY